MYIVSIESTIVKPMPIHSCHDFDIGLSSSCPQAYFLYADHA